MNALPLDNFLERLENVTGQSPRPCSNGYTSLCPAHDDHNPSLSISEGDDGRVLTNCFAGCSTSEICESLDMPVAELFLDTVRTSTQPSENGRKKGFRRHASTEKAPRLFDSPAAAIQELEARHGPASASWEYLDAAGQTVMITLRFERPDGKTFRPVSRHGAHWVIGSVRGLRPLYRLGELADAGVVYVTEGEKAADAARSVGLTATTSSGGCESENQTDWHPLAGKTVNILADNDAPGEKYARDVASILLSLACTVKVVKLPDLPEKGDCHDFVTRRRSDGLSDAEVRHEIERLAAATDPLPPEPPATRVGEYQDFPVEVLPQPVRRFVQVVSRAIGCLAAYVAPPLLAVLGAAVGNSRRLRLKPGWDVPPIVWTLVISESGTAKSPAFRAVVQPVHDRQTRELEQHAERTRHYAAVLARWEKECTAWKRSKKMHSEPPFRPETPHAQRFIVSDITVEAIAQVLLHNPRGVLLARDEAAGWIGSFDQYKKGRGSSDESQWLQMHNGDSVCVDRATREPPTIYIPHAALCITGGIQPGVAKRVLNARHRESGLAARILWTCPPRVTKRWTDASIDPEEVEQLAKLLDGLYALNLVPDEQGRSRPVVLQLTPAAKSLYVSFYDKHNEEASHLHGELAAAWSKLEEYAARFALIIHLIRVVANDPTLDSPDQVDAESMETGITLARWFGCEAKRVYALLTESDDDKRNRELLDWVTRRGGSATVRDVQQGMRQYKSAESAEQALARLVVAGHGRWQPVPSGPNGGRPTQRFILHGVNGTSDLHVNPAGFVDTDRSLRLG